jgi:hypothetical protein
MNERWLRSILTTEKAARDIRKYVCVNVGCTYIYSNAKKTTDRQMYAENRFFSSGIVIIFVVRHAAKNKQPPTYACMCSIFLKIFL